MTIRPVQHDPDHPALTAGLEYAVLGIEADHYRLLDDAGEPALYPPALFEVTDAAEPGVWTQRLGEAGERYACPPVFASPGFFKDYFDRDPQTVATFWQVVNQRLEHAVVG